MGDMADFNMEQDEGWEWDDEGPSIPEGMWMQKNGTLIAIKDMSDTHLENAVTLCQRRGVEYLAYDLKEEQNRRQEIRMKADMQRFPEMKAFIAGWNAGYANCSDKAWPEVGPVMSPPSMLEAWAAY